MRFPPKTSAEIAAMGVWPDGIYHGEVLEAQDTVSQSSGAEMIKLMIKLTNDVGQTKIVFDYLMVATEYKLIHFTQATDQFHKYEEGSLSDKDCEGKTFYCKVGLKPAQGGYEAGNQIKDYLLSDSQAAEKAARKAADASIDEPSVGVHPELDDSIPF